MRMRAMDPAVRVRRVRLCEAMRAAERLAVWVWVCVREWLRLSVRLCARLFVRLLCGCARGWMLRIALRQLRVPRVPRVPRVLRVLRSPLVHAWRCIASWRAPRGCASTAAGMAAPAARSSPKGAPC